MYFCASVIPVQIQRQYIKILIKTLRVLIKNKQLKSENVSKISI